MASENSYAQLIDDYENGVQVIEGESFDEYQKRMGGIDYNAYGGLTGMGYKNGGGIGSMMKSKKVPQLVTPSKDGSRPGYRGPGGYQGGRNASDRATGGQGRAAAREEARSQSNANSDRVSGDQYRAARNDFQQTLAANNAARSGNNTNQTNLTKFGFKKPPNKFKQFFTPSNLASSAIGLFNKPAGILASMFGKMNINNPFAGRGFNPDGTKRTQREYEDARIDRQYIKRLDKMYDRRDAKKNFSQKNIDMIEGYGYRPTRDRTNGLTATVAADSMPKANIINNGNFNAETFDDQVGTRDPIRFNANTFDDVVGTRQPGTFNAETFDDVVGTRQPGTFDAETFDDQVNLRQLINRMPPNDYEMGNPSQYVTADMINEFGDGRMGNINDEFGYSPEFQAGLTNEFGESPEFQTGLINEFGESPEFQTSLINEFGDNRVPADANQGFVNNPYGNSDQGFVNNPYGTSDQGFQGIGETVASITNNELPNNSTFAFAPGSPRDKTLQTLDAQVQNGLFMNDANKLQYEQLLQDDLESGEQLSLPKDRYLTYTT